MMCVQISKKLNLKKKEVDDVLGGEDAWKNVDRTQGMSDFLY
jgi:DNA-directed RNA polymerase III subunit RPC11